MDKKNKQYSNKFKILTLCVIVIVSLSIILILNKKKTTFYKHEKSVPFILIKSGFACITSDNPKYSYY